MTEKNDRQDRGKKVRQPRRSDMVEQIIVERIINGVYPPGSQLPLERDLADELGMGRSTLREAIQRLERDGWLNVLKGTGTTVTDYWKDGTLNILPAMIRYSPEETGIDILLWLTEMRIGMTPHYVKLAVRQNAARVVAILVDYENLPDEAEAYAEFDMRWQIELARLGSNRVYNLWFHTFRKMYTDSDLILVYFNEPEFRKSSRGFYKALLEAAMAGDDERAEIVTREIMISAIENLRAIYPRE